MNNSKVFGLLMLVGSIGFIFAMNVAEFLFPGYSVSNNYISDLGAMCRSGSCKIIQPSSTIFNTSIILLGIAIIAASIIIAMSRERPKLFPSMLAISGVGAIMVGLFPEYTGSLHTISALIVFLFGGLAAIASYKLQGSPMNIISIILGLLTLSSLVLYATNHYLGLGPGGMERMIVYPALLWGAALGAYMMGRADS